MLFAIGIGLLALVMTVLTSTVSPFLGPILTGMLFGVVIGKVGEYLSLTVAVAVGLGVGYIVTPHVPAMPMGILGLYFTIVLYFLSLLFGRVWRSVAKHPQ